MARQVLENQPELFIIPLGGAVIDTPEMREIGLESENLSKILCDIDDLAEQCKI
jgi:ribosome biogenesis GTPase